MKDDRVKECIDYMSFTVDLEGGMLSDESESLLRSVLEEERSADEVVAAYVNSEGLGVSYETGYDEMSNYPGTKCLVNYFNIKDRSRLRQVENLIVSVRTAELFVKPIKGRMGFDYLKEVHAHLFGDIYPSAGQVRTGQASKKHDFCRAEHIEGYASELFSRLEKDDYLRHVADIEDFVNDLAFYMGEAEALHPFKDGNGRAERFFFNKIAEDAGYHLDWKNADSDRMLEAGMAAVDGDYQGLGSVLQEIISRR